MKRATQWNITSTAACNRHCCKLKIQCKLCMFAPYPVALPLYENELDQCFMWDAYESRNFAVKKNLAFIMEIAISHNKIIGCKFKRTNHLQWRYIPFYVRQCLANTLYCRRRMIKRMQHLKHRTFTEVHSTAIHIIVVVLQTYYNCCYFVCCTVCTVLACRALCFYIWNT